jgi:hypothetical protein
LVVDTHPWLPLSQKVLISPISLLEFSADDYAMTVSLSKDMVKSCPKVEEHEPYLGSLKKSITIILVTAIIGLVKVHGENTHTRPRYFTEKYCLLRI